MTSFSDIQENTLLEYDGNKYYVNYNANPNKMRASDCAIRALVKATGLPYEFILQLIREMDVQKYEIDDKGHSVPWGQFGYGKGEGYGVPTLEVLQHEQLKPLVDRVYDFSESKLTLLEFTAFMSTRGVFRNRSMVALLYTPFASESVEDKFAAQARREKNIKTLEKKVQRGDFRLSNYKNIKIDHAVCVKNGKYYDIWDSGRCLVQVVVVFKTGAEEHADRIASKNFLKIGADADSEYMLDRASAKLTAKNLHGNGKPHDDDFEAANRKLGARRTGGIRELFKKNRIPVSDKQFLKKVWLVRQDGSEPFFEYDRTKFGECPGSVDYYQFDYPDGTVGDLNLYKILKTCRTADEVPDSHTYETLKTIYSMSDIDHEFRFDVVQNDKIKFKWRLEFDNMLTYKLRRRFDGEFFVFRFVKK